QDENNFVSSFAGDRSIWLGGYDVYGTSHSTWSSFKWWGGDVVTRTNNKYSNFAGGEPNDGGPNYPGNENYLMMWPDGFWNDIYPTAQLAAMWERPSDWGDNKIKGETQEDYIYKMKSGWSAIQDIRSDLTYRVFTEAHDIVDKRPRYETITSEVPVIKMEQVTNWELVPVLEQQLDWSGSIVTPDGPLDLGAFDLDTLTASGNITINATNDVLVKGSIEAAGVDSTVVIDSAEGNVTVGDDMPVDPMIYDIVDVTATRSIEIDAEGDVSIGETATLKTTSEETPIPDETDIAITSDTAGVTVAGEIHARHTVEINAGTNVTITGIITAANSTIEIFAGESLAGDGNITVHQIIDEDPGDDLDGNYERPSLGGILTTQGNDGEILLSAGSNSGNISLQEANIDTTTAIFLAPAGTVIQSSGYFAGDNETPPSTGGIINTSALIINSLGAITLENIAAEDITAVTSGAGAIEIYNVGFEPEAGTLDPVWPTLVTLTNIETADGPITIETISENLVITNVQSLTDSDDNDILITAFAAGLTDVALELHNITATGDGDVELTIEGTMTHPDGVLIADQAVISSFGEIGTDLNPLNAIVNSLSIIITGDGDLEITNTSGDVVLDNIEIANGSLYVMAHGDILAQNIVLKTDWNTTTLPPSANEVILRTAEGSGGTITVVNITGGTYASTPEEAEAIRLRLLNSLLAEIDPLAYPDIPAELQGPLTDEDDNPILDEQGDPQIVVKLDLAEAQDLGQIIAAAQLLAGDPYVLDEADFANGSTMSAHVAFVVYTALLDVLGISYEASFVDDGSPEWDQTRLERVFSETTDLLKLTKKFTSQGKVTLEADGSIVNGAPGDDVSIIADKVTLIADNSITGLNLAVNKIQELTSLNDDTISVFDKDGHGEMTEGMELVFADGGPINVESQNGLILNNAYSRGPSAGMTLSSANKSLFVRETGSSLISEGRLTLNAGGDLTITGHLVAEELLEITSVGVLSTFGQTVLTESPAVKFNVGSTVTLGGHITGLKEIDVVSAGNVNFLDAATTENRSGFDIYVASMETEQQLLQQLQDNLQQQASIMETLAALEFDAINRKIGQNDVLGIMGGEYLHDLVSLPYNIKQQQLQLQYGGLQSLLDVQSVLPDVIEDMPGYTDLVIERDQLYSNISVLEDIIGQSTVRILEIDGDTADLTDQLNDVQVAIEQMQSYQFDLNTLIGNVIFEINRRDDFIPSTQPGNPDEVRDVNSLLLVDLRLVDNEYLGRLHNDLVALDQEVAQDLSDLLLQEQNLLGQIIEQQGELVTFNLQLQDVQIYIGTTQTQLDDFTSQINARQAAIDDITTVLNQAYYADQDAAARGLTAHSDLLSQSVMDLIQGAGDINGLLEFPLYSIVESDHGQVTVDLGYVNDVLTLLQGMDDISFSDLDARLRALDAYVGVNLGSTGTDLIVAELENVSLDVTTSGYRPYADLQTDLNNFDIELTRLNDTLTIVNNLIEQL
ncbi:MAG: hypothetical protein GY869_23540, partial [Planctomycetes bacterium]|nr:hypothetical protein [Planctomycetota bacterium]